MNARRLVMQAAMHYGHVTQVSRPSHRVALNLALIVNHVEHPEVVNEDFYLGAAIVESDNLSVPDVWEARSLLAAFEAMP